MSDSKKPKYPKYLRGVSLLEIILTIAILALIFPPTFLLLYSFSSNSIGNILPIDFRLDTSMLNLTWSPDGKIVSIGQGGGVWLPRYVGQSVGESGSCIDFYSSSSSSQSFSQLSGQSAQQPQDVYTYSSVDLGFSSTSLATGLAISGQTLFVSVNSSSTTEPDLYAFKIPDELLNIKKGNGNVGIIHSYNSYDSQIKPQLEKISMIDTGPGSTGVKQKSIYLFVSNSSVNSQLQVVDVSNPYNMSVIRNFKIPGSNSTTTPLTKSFAVAGDVLVIGTEKSVLPEISLFDLRDGRLKGTIETGYGVNDLAIINNLLFIAGPKDPEIEIYDISTNSLGSGLGDILPQKIGDYDAPGGSGNGKVLKVLGDTLFLGRTKGGNELLSFKFGLKKDSNNLSDIDLLSTYFTSTSSIYMFNQSEVKIGWSVDALAISAPYILALSADTQREVQIYSFIDSAHPKLEKYIDLPERSSSLACRENLVFMTTQSKNNPLILLTL